MKIGKGKNYIGLGDIMAKAIHKTTGIEPCEGCEKRRKLLNKIKIPFDRPIELRLKEKDTGR